MTAILAVFVGEMMLVVEIEQPLLMGRQQVFPGLRPLEMPVGESSLRINYVELTLASQPFLKVNCYVLRFSCSA